MKRYLFMLLLLLAAGASLRSARRARSEADRLRANLYLLNDTLCRYRTRLDEEAVSVEALRLRCAEFERLRAADAAEIRRLGIRLRRAEEFARTVSATTIEVPVPVRDTVILHDTLRLFRWRDAWVTVEGLVGRDTAACRVESRDTLVQILHRVPRRFLFIRWGTKAVRQEIVSRNPHTKIVYAEYVKIER